MTIKRVTQEMLIPSLILLASLEMVRGQSILVKAAIIIVFAIAYVAFYFHKHRDRWQTNDK